MSNVLGLHQEKNIIINISLPSRRSAKLMKIPRGQKFRKSKFSRASVKFPNVVRGAHRSTTSPYQPLFPLEEKFLQKWNKCFLNNIFLRVTSG